MIRSFRTGSVVALFLLTALWGTAATGIARRPADAWAGTYVYEYLVPTLSGVQAPIAYTLTVRADNGTGTATIKGEGLQTNDEIVCDTRADADRLQVVFRSYPDGGTKNQFGVELYPAGTLMVTLERRGRGSREKLITHWAKYNTDAPKPKGGAVQFKRTS